MWTKQACRSRGAVRDSDERSGLTEIATHAIALDLAPDGRVSSGIERTADRSK